LEYRQANYASFALIFFKKNKKVDDISFILTQTKKRYDI